jgi:hypothetical protein
MAFVYIKKSKSSLIKFNLLWYIGDPKNKRGLFSFPKIPGGQNHNQKPIDLDYSSQNEEDMPLLADSGSARTG